MSSAFYPQGMQTYNNNLPSGGWKTWKGTGRYSYPVATTGGNIRPLTNKDPANDYPAPFGKPRPLKQYRKGAFPRIPIEPGQYSNSEARPADIELNVNRVVASSTGGALVKQMIDNPGSFIVAQNNLSSPDPALASKCNGICIVADYYPNNTYVTDNPIPRTESFPLCCNPERKARRRVLPANTNLPKNYYTTLEQYRENRCQTYDQRIFNFANNLGYNNPLVKPGGPLSGENNNAYLANCQPNAEIYQTSVLGLISRMINIMSYEGVLTPAQVQLAQTFTNFPDFMAFIESLPTDASNAAVQIFVSFMNNPYSGMPPTGPTNPNGCKVVYYKPNNYQFAQQGAVDSSTLILKKNVSTIGTNLASLKQTNTIIYKNKQPTCQAGMFTFNGNPRTCFPRTNSILNKPNGYFNRSQNPRAPSTPLL
jgi:hypothetical protein